MKRLSPAAADAWEVFANNENWWSQHPLDAHRLLALICTTHDANDDLSAEDVKQLVLESAPTWTDIAKDGARLDEFGRHLLEFATTKKA